MAKRFKVILCGDGRVGKTTLRHQYLGENLKKDYMMTIGADFAAKNVDLDDFRATLQIWDLAGQPRFEAIRDRYYQAASGVLLVFDLTNRESFDNIPKWLEEYMSNTENNLKPILLIGNKSDLLDQGMEGIPDEEIDAYVQTLKDWGSEYNDNFQIKYLKTSATHDVNVDKAFNDLIHLMVEDMKQSM